MSNKDNTIKDALLDASAKSVKNSISKYGIAFIVACVLLAAVACVIGLQCLGLALDHGMESAQDAYESAEEAHKKTSQEEQYDHAYAVNEAKYHNSHEVVVRITDIQKISDLEVIKVVEEEVIIQDPEDDKKNIKSWYKASGTGVFTVDLSKAEFIVNNELHYVKVLVFKPEMTDFNFNGLKNLFYADNKKVILGFQFNDGSYEEGEELYARMRQKGYSEVRKAIANNQKYYIAAQSSAKVLIENIIKNVNSNIKDLIVEVEYYDDVI